MTNKIKIFLILGIIVLFLIFLIIRKSDKINLLNKLILNKNLKNVIEKFEVSCDDITDDMYCINSSEENKITNFRTSMNRFFLNSQPNSNPINTDITYNNINNNNNDS